MISPGRFFLILFMAVLLSASLPFGGGRGAGGLDGGLAWGGSGKSARVTDTAPIIVAVASNALRPIMEIAAAYRGKGTEALGSGDVKIVHGSTGKLYTQIIQGAPFHIFLAADEERPRLIEERGMGKEGTRSTYVTGGLALYTSRGGSGIKEKGLSALTGEDVLKIAIANPDTAPYGKAAVLALTRYGIMDGVAKKLVYGENVSQAFSFARTGNADVAIVALSTVYGQGGDIYLLDDTLYDPVVQDGIILKGAPEGAFDFMDFLKGKAATEVFMKYGYKTGGE